MKKLLLVVCILSAGVMGFADAKSDYESAGKIVRTNEAEAVKILQKVSTSGDKEYGPKANFQLGVYNLNKNKTAEAKKNLESVFNAQDFNGAEKEEAAKILYGIALNERKIADAQKYIEWADNKLGANDVDVASGTIIFYYDNNMKSKGDTRYNNAMKSTNTEYKAELNYNIGEYYLTKNNETQAKKYLQTSYGLSKNAIIPAGYLLSQIAINQNNVTEAEKILVDMNNKTGNKDAEALTMLGSYYLQNNKLKEAENYLTKAESVDSKNVDVKVLLLGLYESQSNTTKINSTYNSLKTLAPSKELNRNLGIAYANLGNGKLAEKYLQKAVTENKDNQAKVILGQIYASIGEKEKAVSLLKEAVASKVNGASEILKQVEAMK